jgi:hypothetical protein
VTQGVPAVLVLGAGGILLPADRPEAGLTTSPLVRADPGDGAPLIAGALDRSTVNGNGPEASIERGRAVVVADGDWLKNDAFELLGNNEFLIRALHWIVQAETLIAIPARQGPATVLALTAADLRRIDRAMFVLPPLAVLTLAGGRSAMARLRRRGA